MKCNYLSIIYLHILIWSRDLQLTTPTGKEHLNTIHQQPKYSTQPLSTIMLWWISPTQDHSTYQRKSPEPCHNIAKFSQGTHNIHPITHLGWQAGILWDVICESKYELYFCYAIHIQGEYTAKLMGLLFWWNVRNLFCTMWLHGPNHWSNNLLLVDTIISQENSRRSLQQTTSLCRP